MFTKWRCCCGLNQGYVIMLWSRWVVSGLMFSQTRRYRMELVIMSPFTTMTAFLGMGPKCASP